MAYDALRKSNKFTLDYSEEDILDNCYDFAIFNHHITVNNWMNEKILKNFGKPTYCIVTEVSFNVNPIDEIPQYFDHYILLDPTVQETNRIHAFGRPIEDFDIESQPYVSRDIPKIGSFGFATFGKDWHKIVETVQNEFDEADIHFNIPQGTYIPNYMHNNILNNISNDCCKIIVKPGIKLTITHNNWSKCELINFCSQNTINVFFYNREHIFRSGLSAVTDQAISSGRPLLVTSDRTFRHIHKYLDCYPNLNLKRAIETSEQNVLKMKEDWSSKKFLSKFEDLLSI